MEQLQAVVETRSGFRLDPRTKLLLMAVVVTAEFLYSHTAFMIAVALIPFVLLLTNRQYKTAIIFFCLFTAGLFVQAVQNSIQFPMVINMLVVLLVGLVLRLFPAFVMGAYIIKSTTASECITALGRMHIGRQITIPIDYRGVTDRRPTHIIVVCSASRLGDYFTGSTQSTLWVDGMQLEY